MNKVERYLNKDGKVGVLISIGFGAGWSTWNRNVEEFLLFDSGLVQLALEQASEDEVQEYIDSLVDETHVYTGGWEDIGVVWLDPGTEFKVEEYDGSESLRYRDGNDWMSA